MASCRRFSGGRHLHSTVIARASSQLLPQAQTGDPLGNRHDKHPQPAAQGGHSPAPCMTGEHCGATKPTDYHSTPQPPTASSHPVQRLPSQTCCATADRSRKSRARATAHSSSSLSAREGEAKPDHFYYHNNHHSIQTAGADRR